MYMSTRVHKNTWNRTERFRRARAKEECLSDAVRCCALCMGHFFRTRLQHAQRTRMRQVPRKSRRSRFSKRSGASADVYGGAVSFSNKIEADRETMAVHESRLIFRVHFPESALGAPTLRFKRKSLEALV